jgi:hypothetical protein
MLRNAARRRIVAMAGHGERLAMASHGPWPGLAMTVRKGQ